MIGWFDVSPEGILINQFGAQVGLVTELENSIPFDEAAGEPARDTLRKIRKLSDPAD